MSVSAKQESKRATYPAYKPSGMDWVGDIPSHWEIHRLKRVASLEYGGSLAAEDRLEGPCPVYGSNGVVGNHNLANTNSPCLIIGRKGSFGKVAYSDHPCYAIDTTYFIDCRYSSSDLRWLYYCLQWLRLDAVSKDSAVPGLSREDAYAQVMPYCPLPEQRAIAVFLDREMARIDGLIEKKQRQIELLQEKRAALISHAVTKGLNPNAKMKSSGIDWLGEVPAHWDVKALKRVVRIGNGSTPSRENPEYWSEEGYPWFNSSVVNLDEVLEPIEFVTETALRECHLPKIQPPAVLVGITGQGKTRGMATTLRIEATINQHLAFLKTDSGVCDVEYLRRVLDRAYQFLRVESDGAGSTKGAITCEQLANLRIPVPPLTEQTDIANYLGKWLIRDTDMMTRISQSAEALREYRTALISAAVTGKIDVRAEEVTNELAS